MVEYCDFLANRPGRYTRGHIPVRLELGDVMREAFSI